MSDWFSIFQLKKYFNDTGDLMDIQIVHHHIPCSPHSSYPHAVEFMHLLLPAVLY
jgi:hypothetical protein